MKNTKQIKGHIIIVQEERFRMTDDKGVSYLFGLSSGASASESDLKEWHNRKTELIAEYEGEPDMETGIVHKIQTA